MTSHREVFQQFKPTAANTLKGLPKADHVGLMFDDTETLVRLNDDGTTTPIDAGGIGVEYHTIKVAPSGGDFTNVKDAVDSIVGSSAVNRYVVEVFPAVYTEDNPIQGKTYVTVRSNGESSSVRLVANNPNADMFTMADVFFLSDITISDVTGVGYAANMSVAGSARLDNLTLRDCANGVLCNHASAFVGVINLGIFTTVGTMAVGIHNTNGILTVNSMAVLGASTVTTVLDFDGAGAISTVLFPTSFSSNVGTFLSVDNSSRSVVENMSAVFMTDGVVAAGGADVRLVSCGIFNAITDGIRIDPTGPSTNIGLQGTIVEDSGRFGFNLLCSTCRISGFGQGQNDAFNIVPGAELYLQTISLKPGDEGGQVIGQFFVGIPERPSESALGGGDSYTREMLVYTFDGASYANVSAAARSLTGSTFTFPNLNVNTAIYVASSIDDEEGLDTLQHMGIKAAIDTALVGGAIVAEYWNGAAWVAFNHMSTLSDAPYNQFADLLFQRTGSEQVRYDQAVASAWAKNDDPSVGTPYYWIRFRITSTLTTAPIFEQFKLHTDRYEVNKDGATEYFGAGRYLSDLIVHQKLSDDLSGSAPGNATINFSVNISLALTNNVFANNSIDGVGLVIVVPFGLDTSIPITLQAGWLPSSAAVGDIELEVNAAELEAGDILDGTAPDVNYPIVESVNNQQDEFIFTEFEIDSSTLIPGEVLSLSYFRDATVGNPHDTYTGNVENVSIRAFGSFWRP